MAASTTSRAPTSPASSRLPTPCWLRAWSEARNLAIKKAPVIRGFLSVQLEPADAVVVQTTEVQMIAYRLHRGDHAQVGATGVVQAADDLALLVEGDGKTVGNRLRPHRPRQLGQLRLEPGVAMEEVGIGLARGR